MKINHHHAISGAGKRLGIPTVGPEVLEAALGPAVHHEGDGKLPARLIPVGFDDVAVHRLVIPTLEVELLEFAELASAQQRLIDLGQAVRSRAAARRHRKQVSRRAEIFPGEDNRVLAGAEVADVSRPHEFVWRTVGNVDRE